jgi:hypothetical protein
MIEGPLEELFSPASPPHNTAEQPADNLTRIGAAELFWFWQLHVSMSSLCSTDFFLSG